MLKDKLIIFDMDGTLINSSKSLTKSINYVRSQLSLPPLSVKKVVRLINEPDNDLPRLFYEDRMPYSECRKIFEKHYHENCLIDMELYSGIKELVETLSKQYILTILSNAYGEFVRKMVKEKGIAKYFDIMLGSDDVGCRKPDPCGIFYIFEKFHIKSSDTIYIGDSLKDEMAAKNAGIKYIYVDWGFGDCDNPDAIISKDDLEDIENILKKLL